MARLIPLCVALMLGGMANAADLPEKKPWAWSVEERLAKRGDTKLARRRLEAARDRTPFGPGHRAVDMIVGSANPELFLPHELFEGVIRRGFVDEDWRQNYDLARVGLPADFWTRLESVAEPYIQEMRADREVLERARNGDATVRENAAREMARSYSRMCQERTDALARARSEFGPALDRFMYDVIAIEKTVLFEEAQDIERLRSEARGCR